jgi:phosphatidylglycerol:prolipoprotein diacylglycerol transferase
MFAIAFPPLDPVILQIGPFALRWYALAYIAGLILGWRYVLRLVPASPSKVSTEHLDDYLVWATLGVVLGGRLGYVFFYKPLYYLSNPIEALFIWQGGMSFHGGMIGIALASWLFTRKRGLDFVFFSDLISCAAPIGLFFGRIANFINAELYGRTTDVPWGVIFPNGGPLPRHPSQLYEAALEGALLFILLGVCWRKDKWRLQPGRLSGLFLVGYALARGFVELFRQPDAHIGFLFFGSTMGQLLSLPMLAFGLWLVLRRQPA